MVVSSTLISQHISEWQLMLWNTLILDYFFPNWCSLEYVDKCAPPKKYLSNKVWEKIWISSLQSYHELHFPNLLAMENSTHVQ